MIRFSTIIKKFDEQGEKTGWTYIDVPKKIVDKIKPGTRKTFRVKGLIDNYSFGGIALIPMGGGDFIMALNAEMRKRIGKHKGAKVNVDLEADNEFVIKPPPEFLDSLSDEPVAVDFFKSLAKSHQDYFTKWIESAKTEQTKIKRIADSVTALSRKMGYGEMIRSLKKDRKDLLK